MADGSAFGRGSYIIARRLKRGRCGCRSSLAFAVNKAGTTTNSEVFSLDSNGSADFQPNTDSSSAFLVQSAGSVALFTVDSSLARIYVGQSGGDTVGTLLVLGNKTNAGDPTGVAGSMYYNSNRGSMRCYQSSGWEDCAGGLHLVCDLTSPPRAATTISLMSSGTSATVSGNDAPRYGSSALSSLRQGYCCWGDMGSLAELILGNGDAYTFERCASAGLVTAPRLIPSAVVSGINRRLSQTTAASSATDGTISGHWQAVCRITTLRQLTCDTTDTGCYNTCTDWPCFVAADFGQLQIDGITRCTITSNIPTDRVIRLWNEYYCRLGLSMHADVDYMEVTGISTSRCSASHGLMN
jgi:hypothetical protein